MDSLIERIAIVQHQIWAHWMKYLFGVCFENDDGSYTIPADKVARWKRQMDTQFSDLSEPEQISDIHQAIKVVEVIK